jgi:hypothetical protein
MITQAYYKQNKMAAVCHYYLIAFWPQQHKLIQHLKKKSVFATVSLHVSCFIFAAKGNYSLYFS